MRLTLISILFIFILISCNNNESNVETDDMVSSIVNIPVGPDKIIDTSVAAHLTFETLIVDFDTIQMGQSFKHVFKYTNTGKRPAIISDVQTSCGCTATTYTRDPVKPGESGKIEVTFDSSGKLGYQKKSINVIGNSYPPRTLLYLQGFIEK